MPPRTILYTGKGGVGKTSVAAATARRCAAAGARTLVISTDPAHSLSDVLQAEVGGQPTKVAKRLRAQQVQAQDELEHDWSAVSDWLGGLLMERGVDRIAAEELTVPPGGDELFSLLVLKGHAESEDWDVIALHFNRLVGLIRGDDVIRKPAREFLEEDQQLIDRPLGPSTEPGFVHLRREIVVVEDEAHTEQLVKGSDKDEQVGRVIGVNDIEAVSRENDQRDDKGRRH